MFVQSDAEVALVKEIESKIESLWRQEGTKLQQVFSLLTEKKRLLYIYLPQRSKI